MVGCAEGNSPHLRLLLVTSLLALAGTLTVDLEPAAAPRPEARAKPVPQTPRPEVVDVAFVRNGRLVRVERVVPAGVAPELHALRELAQGPTRAERAKGIRTALRPGARPRIARVEEGVWFLRFSRSLVAPGTADTMRMRLAQIAATLGRVAPTRRFAALSAEGRLVTVLRLGVRPGPWRGARGDNGYVYDLRGVQLRLSTLGFLDRADVSGSLDGTTSHALLAFQGWEGLARTGTVTGETQLALFRASAPRPSAHGPGRRIEIHRDRGVVLVVERNEVHRAVHTSAGAFGATPTGEFRVYRKERMSWSVPFRVWMPYAMYFRGGIAMHEYPIVPSYPASHGCVRLPEGEAEPVYRFVEIGTPVHVF